MDLLASLNLSDLPEQQTHISPYVQEILDTTNETTDLLHLGFNVCCCCANKKVTKSCPGCNRVRYCSQKCLDLDCRRFKEMSNVDERDTALGHTAVICSLLQLCQIDDDVDEFDHQRKRGSDRRVGNSLSNYTKDQIEAAQDRIRSEYESYPATIANILMENPFFETRLKKRSSKAEDDHDFNLGPIKQRRCKRDREKTYSSLIVHVVGASQESELWGDFNGEAVTVENVYEAYAEAFVDLANSYHLSEIRVILIGPNCTMSKKTIEKEIMSDSLYKEGNHSKRNRTDLITREQHLYKLILESYPCDYDSSLWNQGFTSESLHEKRFMDRQNVIQDKDLNSVYKIPKADVIFFFNPGFTCRDYNWVHTVCNLPEGIPLVIATNTEMEALADIQYLNDQGIVSENAEDILETSKHDEFETPNRESSKNIVYFGENPFSGLRVRQNGTMANDLYVKNRWLFIVSRTLSPTVKSAVDKEKEKIQETTDPSNIKDKDLKRRYFI